MSTNATLTNLKARLESEKNKTADENWNTHSGKLVPAALGWIEKDLIKIGHEAATERLMAIVEKAVEVITTSEIALEQLDSLVGDLTVNPHPEANTIRMEITYDALKATKEFLTTLADASGEITKPGHYIINAESFDRIIDDLDKDPSEQVKKAREKFLQLKKESGDGK